MNCQYGNSWCLAPLRLLRLCGRLPPQPQARGDVPNWQHLATPDTVNEQFAVEFRSLSSLTSAKRSGRQTTIYCKLKIMSCWAKQRVVRCAVETSPGREPYVLCINNGTDIKAFALGEKVSRRDGWGGKHKLFIVVSYFIIESTDWKNQVNKVFSNRARSGAVAIPRKGSIRLRLLRQRGRYSYYNIVPFSPSRFK